MACRITEIAVQARDPEAQAVFWAAVLGFVEVGREEGAVEIGPPVDGFGGPQPTLIFIPVSHAKAVQLPLHLDVNPTDRDQAAELERLLDLGARPADVGQSSEANWHVLQDPEGNEFCLLRARVDPYAG